jgi:hypothetical protein
MACSPYQFLKRGGTLEELRSFLNVSSDQFVLAQGWILGALCSCGPYPLMVPYGPQGCSKSTFSKVLRVLVDPNSVPLAPPPRDGADLDVAALYSHVLGFDNISKLSQRLSDSFCRLSTGGGHAQRQFYTRQKQVRFPHVCRPIIANGVTEFVESPDLLDRSIIIAMRYIAQRRTEAEFWAEFNQKRGRIFGALLDALSKGLRDLATTQLSENPRMADFCRWATACGLGNFESIYKQNRLDATLALLEDDQLATAIRALMDGRQTWEGSATKLAKALKRHGLEEPDNAKAFSVRLRKLQEPLRSGYGIKVESLQRRNNERPFRISLLSRQSPKPKSKRQSRRSRKSR